MNKGFMYVFPHNISHKMNEDIKCTNNIHPSWSVFFFTCTCTVQRAFSDLSNILLYLIYLKNVTSLTF